MLSYYYEYLGLTYFMVAKVLPDVAGCFGRSGREMMIKDIQRHDEVETVEVETVELVIARYVVVKMQGVNDLKRKVQLLILISELLPPSQLNCDWPTMTCDWHVIGCSELLISWQS